MDRAARENAAVLGFVRQFEPLPRAGKNRRMIADNGSSAQRRKADRARGAGTRMPVAGPQRQIFEVPAATLRCGLAQQESRAGRRIDLHAMMHFGDFNIELGAERAGGLFDESGEEIDPEAHIAGTDDDGMAGRGFELCEVFRGESRRADDMDDAGLGGKGGEFDAGSRRGEIDNAVGSNNGGERIARDFDTAGAKFGEKAGVLAERRRLRRL